MKEYQGRHRAIAELSKVWPSPELTHPTHVNEVLGLVSTLKLFEYVLGAVLIRSTNTARCIKCATPITAKLSSPVAPPSTFCLCSIVLHSHYH